MLSKIARFQKIYNFPKKITKFLRWLTEPSSDIQKIEPHFKRVFYRLYC